MKDSFKAVLKELKANLKNEMDTTEWYRGRLKMAEAKVLDLKMAIAELESMEDK